MHGTLYMFVNNRDEMKKSLCVFAMQHTDSGVSISLINWRLNFAFAVCECIGENGNTFTKPHNVKYTLINIGADTSLWKHSGGFVGLSFSWYKWNDKKKTLFWNSFRHDFVKIRTKKKKAKTYTFQFIFNLPLLSYR